MNQFMVQLFRITEGTAKNFELDSRVGLNGAQVCWSFPCVFDEQRKTFFVYIGDITIECFTKTTFLNLTNFAENMGATKVILMQPRDHVQKGKPPGIISQWYIVNFQKLFKVLDAERVSKRGMQDLMGEDKLEEHAEKYALYRINL